MTIPDPDEETTLVTEIPLRPPAEPAPAVIHDAPPVPDGKTSRRRARTEPLGSRESRVTVRVGDP